MKSILTFFLSLISAFAIAGGCEPVIVAQPNNTVVCENGNTFFKITATGSGLVYQWQIDQGSGFVDLLNVAPFSGVNTDSLIITAAPFSLDNSTFRCFVSNGCPPNDTSASALLKINVAHSITFQPSNAIACETGMASFAVTTAGTGLSYQWQVNDGSGFVDVPSGPPYSGDTSGTLTITGLTLGMNGYLFQCIVSGSCSAPLTSNSVSLTVNSLPEITSQPNSVNVCDANNTTISIAASGSGVSFQWQLNSGSGFSDLVNGGPYSGVNTFALDISPAALSMDGYLYRCIASGSCTPSDTSAPITLNVYPTYSLFTSATICQGDTMPFGPSNLTAPGFYSNNFTSVNGCDSLVYLSLSVNAAYLTTTASTICSGDSVLLGSMYQSTPGMYSFILPTVSGCDSTIEHTLSVIPSYLFQDTTIICDGDSVLIFGTYENMDSVYTDHYMTFSGCDSMYTHRLIVQPNYDYTVMAAICQGDSILIGGTYESAAGTFTYSYTSMYGCDSVVKTTLTVNPSYSLTQSISICAGDSAFIAGAYQDSAGVYVDSLTTAFGCDSVMVTTLTVGAVPFVSLDFTGLLPTPVCTFTSPFTLSGGSPAGGVYSGPGITSGDLFDPASVGVGMFGIVYTYSDSAGCTSSAIDSIYVDACGGVGEMLADSDFSIYPNPFAEEFTVASDSTEPVELIIYDILGAAVYSQEIKNGTAKIKTSRLAPGVYFAEIRGAENSIVKKLIRK